MVYLKNRGETQKFHVAHLKILEAPEIVLALK
jgi:hypothetical protein